MCGRMFQTMPIDRLKDLFGTTNPLVNVPPRYNLAPTEDVLAVRRNPETGERSIDLLRWGLVPLWAKDPKIGASLINARAESVQTKPAFRDALAKRRCLIPADGFFEWHNGPAGKQPYAIAHRPDEAGERMPLALAGLWERWRSPDGAVLRTVTVITTTANRLLAPIHDRMPVILAPEDWPQWLGDEVVPPADIPGFLKPYPAERLDIWQVSPRVGNIRNQTADLIEPQPSAPSVESVPMAR